MGTERGISPERRTRGDDSTLSSAGMQTSDTDPRVHPFLMFQGQAEQALNWYVSLFPDGEWVHVSRYGPGTPGPEGPIAQATVRLGGQLVMCTDSFVQHAFTFTPAFSLFVDCESEAELQRLSAALAEGGSVLMPLSNYGFSKLFTWVSDRFGVSWQLNLA